MKDYIGTKRIMAAPMTRGEYNAYRGWEIPANEEPADPGYLVEYRDGGKPNDSRHAGYISWSPADVFERSYRLTEGMTFGEALEALKQGGRVARDGWNGKDMFLWLKPAAVVKVEWCRDPWLIELANANGGEILAVGTICMYTADKKILTGWLASQSDLLGEDWRLLD